RAIARSSDAYRRLRESLQGPAGAQYWERFPARSRRPGEWIGEIEKKSQEIARYVLPVATLAYLYHTVSAITLFRYHRLCDTFDAPMEQRLVVGRMIEQVLADDPDYRAILQDPIPLEETIEYAFYQEAAVSGGADGSTHAGANAQQARFRAEFDAQLGERVSILVDSKANNEAVLAQAVREVLGLPAAALDDDAAIACVLD